MLPPSCLSALRARPNERQIHPKCVAMRTTRIEALSELLAGAGCQEKQNLPAKGKVFLLDIPFYRTLYNRIGVVKRHVDPREVLTFLFVEGFGVAVALGVALLMRPGPAFRILRWTFGSTNHLSGH